MKESREPDWVDRMIESWGDEVPGIDLSVEGAVTRINWIARNIRRRMDETLAEHDLSYEEWGLLGHLKLAGPPYASTPGKLAEKQDLSSGAMTNRLDRLEADGLIKRVPDPKDRRSLRVQHGNALSAPPATRRSRRRADRAVAPALAARFAHSNTGAV